MNCPVHSQDFMARAIRTNRELLGEEPQPCVCSPDALYPISAKSWAEIDKIADEIVEMGSGRLKAGHKTMEVSIDRIMVLAGIAMLAAADRVDEAGKQ